MANAADTSVFSKLAGYNVTSEGVEGWFSAISAALWDGFLSFQQRDGIRGDLLEIGIAYGKAALMLAAHSEPEYAIRLLDASMPQVIDTTELVRRNTTSTVHGLYGFSERFDFETLPARSTRFMHIDGDHGRWALHNDLDIANRIVTADGMVVLDDFFSASFVGVTLGAIEWLARNPDSFEMVLAGQNKAYLVRPRFALTYLQFIRDELPAHLRACGHEDFTFFHTDDPRACSCFGITPRQFDRDFVTREFAMGLPDAPPDSGFRL